MNKEIKEIINSLEQTVSWCDRITTGNLPHKIGNLKHGLLNTIELLKVLNLGWHPASEKPAFPKDEDEIWVYCLVYGKGTDGKVLVPMCVKYTKLLMLGWELSENIIVKWWCYPPKDE